MRRGAATAGWRRLLIFWRGSQWFDQGAGGRVVGLRRLVLLGLLLFRLVLLGRRGRGGLDVGVDVELLVALRRGRRDGRGLVVVVLIAVVVRGLPLLDLVNLARLAGGAGRGRGVRAGLGGGRGRAVRAARGRGRAADAARL